MATTNLVLDEGELELHVQAIVTKKRNLDTDDIDRISDSGWVKQSFLIPENAVSDEERTNRVFSSAEFKFQDSSIGGNFVINPPPQFTRYADTRIKGRTQLRQDVTIPNESLNLGMGHYYSEALDDNFQTVHMRFGVPQFNSLTTFFTGFFDAKAGLLARTGRGTGGIFSALGSAVGFVAYLVIWPLWAASLIGSGLRFAMGKPSSKFSYLKPTMPLYWSAVTNMVNAVGVNRGIFPFENSDSGGLVGASTKLDAASLRKISQALPGVFNDSGAIDAYYIASRAQQKKNALDRQLNTIYKGSGEFEGLVKGYSGIGNQTPGNRGTIQNILNSWLQSEVAVPKEGSGGDFERSLKVNDAGEPVGYLAGFGNFLNSEYNDGSAFATFRVDSTGSVNESFSSSIVESDLSAKFNSTASSNKAAYYSFAGGNVIGGAVGSVINNARTAITDFAAGVMDSFNVGGLIALAGSAFVDIPKHWESSMANLPKSTYTMTLISPYGNPISQLTNIYLPLCMLMVGALPISTGKQSYTSPYLLEFYDRGRQQTRYGIIDSLSVTRGTSNLGFNKDGTAMAVEVSFSIADLSSVMSIPIASKTFLQNLNPLDGLLDDENVYTDYLAVLGSLSMYDQVYNSSKLKIGLAKRLNRYSLLTSPSKAAMFLRHNAGILDIFFKGSQRDGSSLTGNSF